MVPVFFDRAFSRLSSLGSLFWCCRCCWWVLYFHSLPSQSVDAFSTIISATPIKGDPSAPTGTSLPPSSIETHSAKVDPFAQVLPPHVYQANWKRHQDAISEAENLFYGFNFTETEWLEQRSTAKQIQWTSYSHTDNMDGEDAMPPVPFGRDDLARVSTTPVLSNHECQRLVEEAETFATYLGGWKDATESRYGTLPQTAGQLFFLQDLSVGYTFVNFEVLPRLFTSISQQFANVIPDPTTLRLGGARIVKYDANAGHVELGMHRDGLLLTVNIALNDASEYTGGGTQIPALLSSRNKNATIRLPKGHALIHPGDILHGGMPITSGRRYVLVLFLLSTDIVPHYRYCSERGEADLRLAQEWLQSNDKAKQSRVSSLIASAKDHFSHAYKSGARVDEGVLLSAMTQRTQPQ